MLKETIVDCTPRFDEHGNRIKPVQQDIEMPPEKEAQTRAKWAKWDEVHTLQKDITEEDLEMIRSIEPLIRAGVVDPIKLAPGLLQKIQKLTTAKQKIAELDKT
jgi:hypothetical protein